ncbi:MAG: LptF/LptG family permease [Candidatus Hydrogenedentes bacterium]|nr:LptF/LptG family permease [Candidatus Hydrogenedentota bacterium]
MKTIDRYLLFRMGSILLQALVALTLVYVFIDLFTHRMIDIRKFHVPNDVVVQYYLNLLPSVIQRIAPFSLLIAALLVLGDAAQNNEVTALTASGVSLRRFVRAPILLALVFAGGLYLLDDRIGTKSAVEADRIVRGYFSDVDIKARGGKSWSNLSGGWTCDFQKFNAVALTGEGVTMIKNEDNKFFWIDARRIYWDAALGNWMLEDGSSCVIDETITATPIRVAAAPITETPEMLLADEIPAETKTAKELREDIKNAQARNVPAAELEVDYHAKYAQPVLSFVMIWLAIPFAMRLRRGGLAIGFASSVIIGITYLIVYAIATSLGDAERISPPVAAWAANAIFLTIGMFMFWRTPT